MADKITRALVTRPTFINGVLHMPGEVAAVDLDTLGVKSLDDDTIVGLEKHSASSDEPVTQVPVAAVAPHAPDAPNPQGIPPGTVQSGTGRLVQVDAGGLPPQTAPAVADADDLQTTEYVGADKPVVDGELTPAKIKPVKAK
jgi:hypothetical protein